MINLNDYTVVRENENVKFVKNTLTGLHIVIPESKVYDFFKLLEDAKMIAISRYDDVQKQFTGMVVHTSDNAFDTEVIRVQFDEMKSILNRDECVQLYTLLTGLVAVNCPEIGKMQPLYDSKKYVITQEPETGVLMVDGADIGSAKPFMLYAHIGTFVQLYDTLPIIDCIVMKDINTLAEVPAAETLCLYDELSESTTLHITGFKLEDNLIVADRDMCIGMYIFLTELLNDVPDIKSQIDKEREYKRKRNTAKQRTALEEAGLIPSVIEPGCFVSAATVENDKLLIGYSDVNTNFQFSIHPDNLSVLAENLKKAITATIETTPGENGECHIELIIDGPEICSMPLQLAKSIKFTLSGRDCRSLGGYLTNLLGKEV